MKNETKDWRISLVVDWVLKEKPYDKVKCPYCHRGKIGGGFKDCEGEHDCENCFGTGEIRKYKKIEPKPEPPQELIEELKQVYLKWKQV